MRNREMDNLYLDFYMLRFHNDMVSDWKKRMLRYRLRHMQGIETKSLRDHRFGDLLDRRNWHRVFTNKDYDSWKEFIIIRDELIDEQDKEYVEQELRADIYSPYDCTGKEFTRWFDWKKLPCGWAVIHAMGLDI